MTIFKSHGNKPFDLVIADAIYLKLITKHNLSGKTIYGDTTTPEQNQTLLSLWSTSQHYACELYAAQQELDNLPTPEFDRFDICEAYYLLESDYNESGLLQERPSNQRRSMSTGVQLHRMQFRPSPLLTYDTLTENGQAIYKINEIRVIKAMFRIS